MAIKYKVNGKYLTQEEWDALPKKKELFTGEPVYANYSIKEYISPMSGKLITSKLERKEEMKKYGVREVDPSEYRSMLRDRGFDERNGQ